MQEARARQPEEIKAKKTISNSFTKAVRFLFEAHTDRRIITNRGLFDRSVIELNELAENIRIHGYHLNELSKSYLMGTSRHEDLKTTMDNLQAQLSSVHSFLESFNQSYSCSEDR